MQTIALRIVVVACGLAVVLVAACTPQDPPPPPPSSQSVTGSEGSSSPSPTTSQQERDYQEAAEAFTNANRVVDQALVAGDGKIPEEEFARYAVPNGRFWRTEAQGAARLAGEGKRFEGSSTVVKIVPVGTHDSERLSMYVCVDGRDAVTVHKNGTKERLGILGAARLTFRKEHGQWRVDGYAKDQQGNDLNFQKVTACETDPK